MYENKAKVWLARDKDSRLWAYPSIPFRDNDMWNCDEPQCEIDSSKFPSVKWEDDEPTEAYITLANEQQEQLRPTKEIDWEQRRYEIVKDILIKKYPDVKFNYELVNEIKFAKEYADFVINELKKQSE